MRTRQAKQMLRGYMNEVNTITENASVDDETGRWGLDPWIRIIHELVDLQLRTTASIIQGALAGPSWLQQTSEELDAETVDVSPSAPYPRIVSASAFVRVGQPTTKIPPASLDLEPDVLPAGATQIQIRLKDYRYVGANYKGKITLKNANDPSATPQTVEITVGL
ncbi:MAG TPA: hypothetical protein VGP27_01500 [Mycobacterium sp.]|jgi:hypothetical protein|nr:hypothetical protein [Mycobacterium sp.]